MSSIQKIPLYTTPPHSCSYLKDRVARMSFVDPAHVNSTKMLSILSRYGFRRSGSFIYRPKCHHCQQCISVRIDAHRFKMGRTHRKLLNRSNSQLQLKRRLTTDATDAHYHLYSDYISERHHDGDMYPPNEEQFFKFIVETNAESFFLEFWYQQRLVAVALSDVLDDGLSAIYTFYDPHFQQISLGTLAIIQQVRWTLARGLDYVYLGYWVSECEKMNYKINFNATELYVEGQWQPYEEVIQKNLLPKPSAL